MTESELDYTELEFITTEIEDVNNLLKIMIETLFDDTAESRELTPFARQFDSVLSVSIGILKNKAEQIYKIFNMLFEADKSGEYKIPKRQQSV